MSESVKQVFSPDGVTLWASAPDASWYLRSEPFPEIGVLVEVCWSKRFSCPETYEFAFCTLKEHHINGKWKMSTWKNEFGQDLCFNPDFWRPIQA